MYTFQVDTHNLASLDNSCRQLAVAGHLVALFSLLSWSPGSENCLVSVSDPSHGEEGSGHMPTFMLSPPECKQT